MNAIKTIGRLILILISSIFVGTVLLYLVFLLPTDGMLAHARDSAQVFSIEKTYPLMDGTEATKLDNWTDSLMLLNAFYNKEDTGTMERAMEVYQPVYESGNPTESLILFVSGEEPVYASSYSRYWHGYLVILKPILLGIGYLGIRGINRILQPLLVLAAALVLWRRHGFRPVLPLAAAYLFLRPESVAFSMQFSTVFYPAMAAILVMAWFHEWLSQKNRLLFLFLLLGIVTNYLDYLTYPIASLGIPMGMWLCLDQKARYLDQVKQVILCSLCWGFGYFGMWIGKWGIGSLLLDHSILADALTQAQLRSSSQVGTNTISRGLVILQNLYTGTGGRLWLAGLFLAVVLAAALWQARWNGKELVFRALPFLLVALMPFVWYGVLCNHSFVHHWFTYRALAVSVFAGVGLGVTRGSTL